MCCALLNFCDLLQLQSVPLLTSALLGSQRCALPPGLASAQPVWQKGPRLSPAPHPPPPPFPGVSCTNVTWWDQSPRWRSDWSGRQQLCIPWHRAFLQLQLEEPGAFHKVWVCRGAVKEPGEVVGVKGSENNFLKKKRELLHFWRLCLRWFHKERRKLADNAQLSGASQRHCCSGMFSWRFSLTLIIHSAVTEPGFQSFFGPVCYLAYMRSKLLK